MTNSGRPFLKLTTLFLAVFLLLPAFSQAEQLTVSGFTEPFQDSTLGLSVTGQIAKIQVKAGDMVKKGQTILMLEQDTEALEIKRRKIISASTAETDAVTEQLKTIKSHFLTSKELYETTKSVPRDELENQELDYKLTEVELTRLQDMKKREAVELAIAKSQLEKRILRAPFSGTIADILVAVGENCETDTELVQLVDTSKGYFLANVELNVSQLLEIGTQVELQFKTGMEPLRKDAEISFISPVVDPASGLRKIKASFENADGAIIPGMAGSMLFESAL